jgi:hypothetical protein
MEMAVCPLAPEWLVCMIRQQTGEPCLQVAPVCLAGQRWAGSGNEEQPSISVRAVLVHAGQTAGRLVSQHVTVQHSGPHPSSALTHVKQT